MVSKNGFTVRIAGIRIRSGETDVASALKKRLEGNSGRMVRYTDNQALPEKYIRLREEGEVGVELIDDRPLITPRQQFERSADESMRGSSLPLRIITESGRQVRAEDVLGLPPETVFAVINSIEASGPRQFHLSILGKVGEAKVGSRTYEVVLGLKSRPYIRRLADQLLAEGSYTSNSHRMITNINPVDARELLGALNNKYQFGLRIFSTSEASTIMREWSAYMQSNGITWFWTKNESTGDSEEFIVNTRNANAIHDQKYRDEQGGLVFGRLKPE